MIKIKDNLKVGRTPNGGGGSRGGVVYTVDPLFLIYNALFTYNTRDFSLRLLFCNNDDATPG